MQRPEPAANLQILKSAYGSGNVLQVAPSQLMDSMDSVDGGTTGAVRGGVDAMAKRGSSGLR